MTTAREGERERERELEGSGEDVYHVRRLNENECEPRQEGRAVVATKMSARQFGQIVSIVVCDLSTLDPLVSRSGHQPAQTGL